MSYTDDIERDVERMLLDTMTERARADERALEAALATVDPMTDWTAVVPDSLPQPSGDPRAYALALTEARSEYLRRRWDVLSARAERQRERTTRSLDSYIGGGSLSLDTLLGAARAAEAAKPAPTLAEERAAGEARRAAQEAAKQARVAELKERAS